MAYKTRKSQPVDRGEIIPGNGCYMAPGRHDVIIESVQVAATGRESYINSIKVIFRNKFQDTHKETIFLRNTQGDGLSSPLRDLISCSLYDSPDIALELVGALESEDWSGLGVLSGTKVGLVIVKGEKYTYVGNYYIPNSSTTEVSPVLDTGTNTDATTGAAGTGNVGHHRPKRLPKELQF